MAKLEGSKLTKVEAYRILYSNCESVQLCITHPMAGHLIGRKGEFVTSVMQQHKVEIVFGAFTAALDATAAQWPVTACGVTGKRPNVLCALRVLMDRLDTSAGPQPRCFSFSALHQQTC